jgi:hypothetical protein
VFAKKNTASVFAHPADRLVAVIGIEHDSGASSFEREDASDYVRQHSWPYFLIDELGFSDGAVKTDVVSIGVIPRRDGVLRGAIQAASTRRRVARSGSGGCGRFIHSDINSASAAGSARRRANGAANVGVGGAATARTASEISVSSRGSTGAGASSMSVI